MLNKAGLVVVAWISMLGLSVCHTPPSPETFSTQQALVGMTEGDILACAGPPLRRVTLAEEIVFLYVQGAGTVDRTFAGSKGSISDIRHGCEADITVQAGEVTDAQYRPFPEGSGA